MRTYPSRLRRALAGLLSLALVLSLWTLPAAAGETTDQQRPSPEPLWGQTVPRGLPAQERAAFWPQDLPDQFRTLWSQTDPKALLTQLDRQLAEVTAAIQAGAPAEQVLWRYHQMSSAVSQIYTGYAMAYWDYFRQPQANGARFARWSSAANETQAKGNALEHDLLNGPYAAAMTDYLGQATVTLIKRQPVSGPEQLALQEQETALVDRYNTLKLEQENKTVSWQGKDWTLDQLYDAYVQGTLDARPYLTLSEQLLKEKNQVLGQIYLELVALRNRFAQSLGYENYAAYAYEAIYDRDYSLEQAQRFCSDLLTQFGSWYHDWENVMYLSPNLDLDEVSAFYQGITAGQMLELVQGPLAQLDQELGELFRYMQDNQLLDLNDSEENLPSAFCNTLPAYGSAYLFVSEEYFDPFTLVHEFGHYTNSCLAPDVSGSQMDVAEIHSTGLEAIYHVSGLPQVVDPSLLPGMTWSHLRYNFRTLLDAAVFGSLELAAYTKKDLDLDWLNRYAAQLFRQAGYQLSYGDVNYTWVDVHHLFQAPCYYISYGFANANALELMALAQEDPQAALACWQALVDQTDVLGYQKSVEQAGLQNMLQSENLTGLRQDMADYLYEDFCQGKPLTDVSKDRWSYDTIHIVAGAALLPAAAEGRYEPARAITGGELAAALDKLVGNLTQIAAPPEQGWGLDPKAPLTRADLAQAFYRLGEVLGMDLTQQADLSGYADAGQLSPETAKAFGWTCAQGLLQGTAAGRLSPQAPATREQAATVLLRAADFAVAYL